MTIWFVAAAVVLIVELFIGTVYLLVVSVALAAAGIIYGLSAHFSAAVLTAAIISALGIWLVHGRLKNQLAPQALNDDWILGKTSASYATCMTIFTKSPTAGHTGRHKPNGLKILFRRPQAQSLLPKTVIF